MVIKQTDKQLYQATFDIITPEQEKVGEIRVDGHMASMEGTITVNYRNREYIMTPVSKKEAKEDAGSSVKTGTHRPYRITGAADGLVYHDQMKTGFLETAGFHAMILNGTEYRMFVVGLGADGICAPAFCGEDHIGSISKPAVVVDDLHTFGIATANRTHKDTLVLFACYMYILSYYEAGDKKLKSIRRKTVTTKNKYMLEQLNKAQRYRENAL